MSWLRKIVSTIRSDQAEQALDKVTKPAPASPSLVTESASASEPIAEENSNPTGPRRYFVKRGVFVDHENEAPATAGAEEEIPDQPPVDLRSIFPKLSLR